MAACSASRAPHTLAARVCMSFEWDQCAPLGGSSLLAVCQCLLRQSGCAFWEKDEGANTCWLHCCREFNRWQLGAGKQQAMGSPACPWRIQMKSIRPDQVIQPTGLVLQGVSLRLTSELSTVHCSALLSSASVSHALKAACSENLPMNCSFKHGMASLQETEPHVLYRTHFCIQTQSDIGCALFTCNLHSCPVVRASSLVVTTVVTEYALATQCNRRSSGRDIYVLLSCCRTSLPVAVATTRCFCLCAWLCCCCCYCCRCRCWQPPAVTVG